MKQYNEDKMENAIPSEQLEIWNMRHILVIRDKETQVIIKLGRQADGYWKSENMVKQLREKTIPIFNALHPGCIDEKNGIVKFKGIKK
ncbi:10582_t:CDS:2, partial [Gigaspora rosea]